MRIWLNSCLVMRSTDVKSNLSVDDKMEVVTTSETLNIISLTHNEYVATFSAAEPFSGSLLSFSVAEGPLSSSFPYLAPSSTPLRTALPPQLSSARLPRTQDPHPHYQLSRTHNTPDSEATSPPAPPYNARHPPPPYNFPDRPSFSASHH